MIYCTQDDHAENYTTVVVSLSLDIRVNTNIIKYYTWRHTGSHLILVYYQLLFYSVSSSFQVSK
jgi:hypothetical protein